MKLYPVLNKIDFHYLESINKAGKVKVLFLEKESKLFASEIVFECRLEVEFFNMNKKNEFSNFALRNKIGHDVRFYTKNEEQLFCSILLYKYSLNTIEKRHKISLPTNDVYVSAKKGEFVIDNGLTSLISNQHFSTLLETWADGSLKNFKAFTSIEFFDLNQALLTSNYEISPIGNGGNRLYFLAQASKYK